MLTAQTAKMAVILTTPEDSSQLALHPLQMANLHVMGGNVLNMTSKCGFVNAEVEDLAKDAVC